MRLLKIYCILLVILSTALSGCKKMLEPENDNHATLDFVKKYPAYAEGVLLRAYAQMPSNNYSFNEMATDDAVSSNKLNNYLRMATGEWSAIFSPVSQWSNALSSIQYINLFLSFVNEVPWKPSNPSMNDMFIKRYTGEAYAMRAWFEYILLQDVAGVGTNGQLLGFPIYLTDIKPGDNFNVARATFAESVAQIYADCDKALEYLTMNDFVNVTSTSQLPAGYTTVATGDYNIIFGILNNQRISGRIVKAMKGRVALLAASPAYANDATLWATAANYAAATLDANGGLAGLDPNGHRWYENSRVNSASVTSDQKEMLWRGGKVSERVIEQDNFPPSLFGNAVLNPTQNLVDAFPMANGYPILASALYNPANPYAGRDPRLARYIIYNGNTLKSQIIYTGVGGGANAKDSIPTSTRTGYYMKKLMRDDVNLDPTALTSQNHYDVHIRYTEIFLNYAEAANEAWDPDGTGPNGYSARQVIKAIRQRAGIIQPDNYLASITRKDDMRALIRNERRIELCFEGFRFNDLRRWKADMAVTARGVNTNKAGTSYTYVDVEPRAYDNSFMFYAPIPQNETIKYNALVQNQGW